MGSIKYEIIEIPSYTSRSKVGIKTLPENEPLMLLLSGLKKEQFPHYINELFENINFGVENASFVFYHQMDWEDKSNFKNVFGREMNHDELEIQVYDGRRKYSVLNKSDFEQIFYDYSQKLLEVYQSDTSLPETWKDEMNTSLEKLKSKINNESPR